MSELAGDPGPPARVPERLDPAAIVGSAFVLQLLRQAGVRSWDTLFAEDGGIFLQQARDGGPEVLAEGYAGYSQLMPRLLGELLALVPVDGAAWGAASLAALTGSFVAWFVWWAAFPIVRGRVERAVLGVSVAVAPPLVNEVTASITNTIWLLLFAGFWAAASRRAGRGAAVLRGSVVVLAVLSTALAAVLVPMAAWRATLGRRSPADRVPLAGLGVGLTLQLLVIASSHESDVSSVFPLSHVPGLFTVRVLGSWLLGDRFLPGAWGALGFVLVGLLVAAAAGVVVLLARFRAPGRRDRDVVALLAAATAGAGYVLPMVLRGVPIGLLADEPLHMGVGRFSAVPVLLLVSASLLLVDRMPHRLVRAAVLAHLAVVCSLSFTATNARSPGPSWDVAVLDAAEACRNFPPEGEVAIAGSLTFLTVPCAELRG